MQFDFWSTRWAAGRIGFHQDHPNENLENHWSSFLQWLGAPSTSGKVMVPLCGKSQDMTWLAEHGHGVSGVEFVETAAEDYFRERGLSPDRRAVGEHVELSAPGGVRVLVGDFFALAGDDVGQVDLVYDRAALVAIEPSRRAEYVAQIARLLRPGGGLFLVSFEHDMPSGPPFSVPEVAALLEPGFEAEERSRRDLLEQEPRFKESGATYLSEIVWYARRR